MTGLIGLALVGAVVGVVYGMATKGNVKSLEHSTVPAGIGAIGSVLIGWLIGHKLLGGHWEFFELRTWITGALGAAGAAYLADMFGGNGSSKGKELN